MVEKPNWVRDRSYGSRNTYNSEQPSKQNKNDNRPVFNSEKDMRFKIPDNSLKFGNVFTAKVGKQFDKIIRNEDGDIVYHCYHIKGICNANCKLKSSHKKLSNQKMNKLNEFVKFAFDSHPKLKSSTNNETGTVTNANSSG